MITTNDDYIYNIHNFIIVRRLTSTSSIIQPPVSVSLLKLTANYNFVCLRLDNLHMLVVTWKLQPRYVLELFTHESDHRRTSLMLLADRAWITSRERESSGPGHVCCRLTRCTCSDNCETLEKKIYKCLRFETLELSGPVKTR